MGMLTNSRVKPDSLQAFCAKAASLISNARVFQVDIGGELRVLSDYVAGAAKQTSKNERATPGPIHHHRYRKMG